MLLTFPTTDSPAQKLLQSRGFEVAQQAAQRRLLPQRLDYADLAHVARDATDQASDYELVRLHGPAPDEWIPQLGRLFEALNDAPLDGIDLEPDLFPDERVRRYEQALATRGQDVYRLMARHRPTGELAGHTIVCVDRCRPGFANQEDTAVLPAHRGHRLGLLLKSSMLLWLRDDEPHLRVIDTWNAESNAHMIAVNDRLGSRVSGRATAVQLHLT
jgi:GNAT superfamily N-acetyltransferase